MLLQGTISAPTSSPHGTGKGLRCAAEPGLINHLEKALRRSRRLRNLGLPVAGQAHCRRVCKVASAVCMGG